MILKHKIGTCLISLDLLARSAFAQGVETGAPEIGPLGPPVAAVDCPDTSDELLAGDASFTFRATAWEDPSACVDWFDREKVTHLLSQPIDVQMKVWTDHMLAGGTFGRYDQLCARLDSNLARHFNKLLPEILANRSPTPDERRFLPTFGVWNKVRSRQMISIMLGLVPGQIGFILGLVDKSEKLFSWLDEYLNGPRGQPWDVVYESRMAGLESPDPDARGEDSTGRVPAVISGDGL